MTETTSHRPARAHAWRIALLAIIVAASATPARAQAARADASNGCAPRLAAHGPAFAFGNEAGNLRRNVRKLWADGSTQQGDGARTLPDAAIADSVRALARAAHRSAFWTTVAPRITRPTRNPDMAREYIAAHLRCGAKRSLYPADAEPPAFRALFARLARVAELAAGH